VAALGAAKTGAGAMCLPVVVGVNEGWQLLQQPTGRWRRKRRKGLFDIAAACCVQADSATGARGCVRARQRQRTQLLVPTAVVEAAAGRARGSAPSLRRHRDVAAEQQQQE
jgi:hypothetical protein